MSTPETKTEPTGVELPKPREVDLPTVEAPKVNHEEVKLEGKEPAGRRSKVSRTEAWKEVDWANKDSVYTVFPGPQREKIALARAKNVSNVVDLRFDLKMPLSNKYLLQDARLLIEPNRKTVLFGEHASGKSVLFRAIAHGGIKEFPKHISVHFMEELEVTEEPISCLEAVVAAHEFRNVLVDCDFEVRKRIEADPASADKYDSVMEMLRFNLDKVKSDDAYERASKMLRVLGFDQHGQSRSTNSLSGGLRMRIALAAAFFVEADLLLLDEPTNHLDFPSVLWLENRLRSYRNSFIIIAHDRDMLENVCSSLIWLTDKTLKYFPIGFKEFEKKREREDAAKDLMIDKFMQSNRNVDPSSPKAKQKDEYKQWQEAYQARKIMLQGKFTFPDPVPLERQEDDPEDPKEISILNLKDCTFSYDNGVKLPFIFKEPINFNVKFSTRCGVMGPNGAGKSTLLKLLTKRLTPTTGSLTQHPTATIAYFAQHHVAELSLDQTPIDFMCAQFPEVENSGILRKHLAKVGIQGPMAETRMIGLSSGQRSCVIFAKITYICPHLLIMDEPTNFLDLDSVDSLIAATNKYPGALLLVSHNRGFLKKCATQYLSVVPGRFEIYDDLKSCERATYSFIAELEEGTTSGAKLGASALQQTSTALGSNQPGGPKAKDPVSVATGGVKLFSISSVKPAAAKKPAPAVPAKGAPPAKGAVPAKGAPAKGPAKQAPKAGGRR